jgi:hypothetical protein
MRRIVLSRRLTEAATGDELGMASSMAVAKTGVKGVDTTEFSSGNSALVCLIRSATGLDTSAKRAVASSRWRSATSFCRSVNMLSLTCVGGDVTIGSK